MMDSPDSVYFNSIKVQLKHAVAYEDYITEAISIP